MRSSWLKVKYVRLKNSDTRFRLDQEAAVMVNHVDRYRMSCYGTKIAHRKKGNIRMSLNKNSTTEASNITPRGQFPKNQVCIWYDGGALEAAKYYAQTFPNSSVGAVSFAPSDNPSTKEGAILTVEFTVMGIPCIGLNGGPSVKHNWAFSMQVLTEDQEETDRYWNAIVSNGGEESMCGWCQDKWGVHWQITPIALVNATTSSDRSAAKRAFDAMMTMKKIDIQAIEAAFSGH